MSTIKSRFQAILILAAIVFPLFSQPALAYKPDLHVKFSKLSWYYATNLSRSQLGRVELNHFGNEFVSNRFNYKELESPYQITDKTNGNGQDMIAYGAMWEDEKPPSSFLGFRPFNHFYDPQNQRPLTIELPIWKTPDFDPQNPSYFSGINVPAGADVTLLGGMVLGNTSTEWILELEQSAATEFAGGLIVHDSQQYSYFDALTYFSDAMKGRTPAQRKTAMANLYQSLGHILHHIQDMGQPQHVRNDMHCDACPINDISTYEVLTGDPDFMGKMEQLIDFSSIAADNAVMFNNPLHYWENPNYNGMAQFASANFISTESNYYLPPGASLTDNESLVRQLSSHDSFPLPLTYGLFLTKMSASELFKDTVLTISKEIEDRFSGSEFTFIGRQFTDTYFNKTVRIDRLATISLFGHDLIESNSVANGSENVLSLNQFNYDSHMKALLPRIVAFSEGFLRYFFRNKLTISVSEQTDSVAVRVTNNIATYSYLSRSMTGLFRLYAEDSSGIRTLLNTRHRSLAFGESSEVNIDLTEFPANTRALAVVFEVDGTGGILGGTREERILMGVGGGYLEYTPASPPEEESCVSGRVYPESPFTAVDQIGTEPRTMSLYYRINAGQAQITVAHGNTVVADTGVVSGQGWISFYYDPAAQNGSTTIYLFINSTAYTYWALYCAR